MKINAVLGAQAKWREAYSLYGEDDFVQCDNEMRHLRMSSI